MGAEPEQVGYTTKGLDPTSVGLDRVEAGDERLRS